MMTNSDISAVDEFLAFSLPSDSAAQLARRDAIAKAMDSRQSTTALVGYRATGLVLIVGPEPYALSVAEELVGKVTLAILATEGNNLSAGSEKPVFTREIDGQIILVAAADLMDVGGYLGAFEVTVDINGESQNLAGLMNLTSQTFDVVLDLGRKPAITLELLPPGYFAVSANRENMPKVLEEIAGLNGEFEKPQYVHYDPDICAHGERGITGCTRCIDTCPAGAVISIGERVEVDVHRCHGMGSCSAV
ncbi:MAG: 4Fe-4S dicluster domain-containing protein, partial [Arenicellales bacterium]|nr:4Fe-4S dicluster domain-containing protein [Arenicellales bacterium]